VPLERKYLVILMIENVVAKLDSTEQGKQDSARRHDITEGDIGLDTAGIAFCHRIFDDGDTSSTQSTNNVDLQGLSTRCKVSMKNNTDVSEPLQMSR
jgi:hypothetical protein